MRVRNTLLATLMLAFMAGCSDGIVSNDYSADVMNMPSGIRPLSNFGGIQLDMGATTTTPVVLNSNECTEGTSQTFKISYSVSGNQAGTATFYVNQDWAYDGSGWAGSNPAEITVDPQSGGTVTYHPVTVTLENASSQESGTSTVSIPTFGLTNDNATGAKLDGSAAATVYVEFAGCAAPAAPPTLTLPSGVVEEATGPDGAIVSFSALISATDYLGNDITADVTCNPASGSLFPLGTTPVNCSVSDGEGRTTNGSFDVTVVDTTPPDVSVTGVSDGATYVLGSVPSAGCSTTDLASGVATHASLTLLGGPVGAVTATCSGATDNAGNVADPVSATYYVVFDWDGFFRPIDNLPVTNSVKAGSAIPIKFSLNGDQGLDIFAAGYPRSVPVTCDSDPLEGDVEETVTAGKSGLTYDPLTDEYNYAWKTDRGFRDCRMLEVKLVDDTVHRALFKFR